MESLKILTFELISSFQIIGISLIIKLYIRDTINNSVTKNQPLFSRLKEDNFWYFFVFPFYAVLYGRSKTIGKVAS